MEKDTLFTSRYLSAVVCDFGPAFGRNVGHTDVYMMHQSTHNNRNNRGNSDAEEGSAADHWDVLDFYGKYHLSQHADSRNRVRAKHPIPGTAIRRDQAIQVAKADALQARESKLKALKDDTENRIARKAARERMVINSMFEIRVGSTMDKFEAFLEDLEAAKPGTDVHDPAPLHVRYFEASRRGVIPVCLSSIDQHGVDPNSRDQTLGNTALHYAVSKGHVDLCEVLLRAGADPNIPNHMGDYPIHHVWDMMAGHGRHVNKFLCWEKINKMLRSLLKANAETDIARHDGTCAIHLAAKYGPSGALIMLLEFKADHRVIDSKGETAKEIAERHGHDVSVRMLALWDSIREALGHLDFGQQWRKFCADTTQRMDYTVDTQKLLFNLHLQQAKELKRLETDTRMLKLDDDFLRQMLKEKPLKERLESVRKSKNVETKALVDVNDADLQPSEALGPAAYHPQESLRLRDRRARAAQLVGKHGDFTRTKLNPGISQQSLVKLEADAAAEASTTTLSLKDRLGVQLLPNGGSSLASMLARVNEQEQSSDDDLDNARTQKVRFSEDSAARGRATKTRKSFVPEHLLPPRVAPSYLDKIRKDFEKAQKLATKESEETGVDVADDNDVMARLQRRREQANSQKAALVSATKDAGRLVSALSLKGQLQYPWD